MRWIVATIAVILILFIVSCSQEKEESGFKDSVTVTIEAFHEDVPFYIDTTVHRSVVTDVEKMKEVEEALVEKALKYSEDL